MAKTWIKGLGAAAVLGVLVAGGMYLYGSASGDVPPATVDFAKLGPQEFDTLYKRGEQVFRAGDCAACAPPGGRFHVRGWTWWTRRASRSGG